MDPVECLEDLLRALLAGDRDGATIAYRSLRHWLELGGFTPSPSEMVDRMEAVLRDHHNRTRPSSG